MTEHRPTTAARKATRSDGGRRIHRCNTFPNCARRSSSRRRSTSLGLNPQSNFRSTAAPNAAGGPSPNWPCDAGSSCGLLSIGLFVPGTHQLIGCCLDDSKQGAHHPMIHRAIAAVQQQARRLQISTPAFDEGTGAGLLCGTCCFPCSGTRRKSN